MIKAIIFDFWGTLVENGIKSPIKQVKEILEITLPFPEYVVRMEKAMMASKHENLKSAFESVCQEFSIIPTPEQLDSLIGLWNKSWMLAQPYQEIEETLQELRKQYELILISNTDQFSINNVLEKFNLKIYFNSIFFSYQTGMIKTDQNFLKHVLQKNNLNRNEVIVVGDSIQSDIMPAKMLGIKAILVDRNERRTFQPKIKNLKELKNLI